MAYKSAHGVDDMVMLSKITQDAIVDNLKKRYNADTIYTYIGNVLIAVNPFKMIKQLYTEKTLLEYRGKYRYELQPHVYAVADDMYRLMLAEGQSQCVIISGESGAGKTETAKLIMQYMAAVSGKSAEVVRVKDVILESNPLLEAFGNAKTLRNNNSSRFGKYLEIQFDLKGDPIGGRITNYLLEKSRVIYQTKGERTFHIFYNLVSGADSSLKSELGLLPADQYHYLNQSGCYTVDGMDDRKDFEDVVKAMNVIGLSNQEQKEVWRLLAAILILGNITFTQNAQDEAQINSQGPLTSFASLFRADIGSCQKALCFRTISTGTQGRSARNVEGAEYSRDALAKALYARLFDWIVEKVNIALGFASTHDALQIGVLDIYGFEIFETNGFEQLCINYVNERLQQIFIELTLKAEQEEYHKEGIQWEQIDYFNNKICCDLIESKKPMGLLTLLDDDQKFFSGLVDNFASHPHFKIPPQSVDRFVVVHYAGDVEYRVTGMVDKNKDLLFNDFFELASYSSSTLIPTLFPEIHQDRDKKKPTTAGFKIKESISALVKTLSSCTPHYIRCIKPNGNKRPNDFDNGLTTHQVQYLGLLENVRIRRAGQVYDKFFFRYRVCCKETWPSWKGSYQEGAEAILRALNIEAAQYRKGTTKIFIRAPETVFSLEELRERKVVTYANKIQRFFQRFTMVSYYYQLQKDANDMEKGKKERRRVSLERPFSGDYINYRENFLLKGVVAGFDRNEKVVFAHAINKFDRRGRTQRRVLLLTDTAIYIVAIERNKDKEEKIKKPWIYVVKRRLLLTALQGLEFSKFCDNFVMLKASEFDNLIECRRKTEFLGTILKYHKNLRVNFSNQMDLTVKGGKKPKQVTFDRGGQREEAKIKGNKITVGDGLSADSTPNLKAPENLPVHQIQKEIVVRNPNARNAPGGRGVPQGGGAGPGYPGGAPAKPPPGAMKPVAPPGSGRAAPMSKPPPAIQKKAAPVAAPAPAKQQVKALYDFEAEHPDELTMKQGVLSKEDDNWWEGQLASGARGKFPTNYVEIVKSGGGVAKPAATPVKPSFSGAPPGRAKPPGGMKPMGKPAAGRGRG